ncbi:MAG TPA: hypothetical protein VFR85_12775 [Anaeromyxobacteraceae bacterium]|nr:hypothetical protein [Anaeromyxobacteraceae bacterium]
MTTTRLVAFAAAVLTMAAPCLSRAQAAAPGAKKKPSAKKVLRAEEMKVQGRIQKPQAVFLMPRTNPSHGDLDRAQSFLPKVIEATEKEPF